MQMREGPVCRKSCDGLYPRLYMQTARFSIPACGVNSVTTEARRAISPALMMALASLPLCFCALIRRWDGSVNLLSAGKLSSYHPGEGHQLYLVTLAASQ